MRQWEHRMFNVRIVLSPKLNKKYSNALAESVTWQILNRGNFNVQHNDIVNRPSAAAAQMCYV